MKRVPWWVFAGILLPFGLGGIAAIVPGIQRRKPLWIAAGVLAVAMIGIGQAVDNGPAIEDDSFEGLFYILGWVLSIVTVLAIRRPYLELEAAEPSAWDRGLEQAEARLRERQEALALCESNPALAVELGVGRPDVPRARHAGVVDVNHASAEAIASLPGLDAELGRRTVEVREQVNGFTTLADYGLVLDLDGNQVERLRDRAVFLPR